MAENLDQLKSELKKNIVEALALEDITAEDIGDDDPLFAEKLGLDSLDAVEIVVILQRKFGVNTKGLEKRQEVFYSINTLAKYIAESRNG
ncbi:MAG: phosphopantetheine-binding protein [Victivallaceae bacterium]